ncbi:MAG: hypothetical protein QOJ63_1141 [Solirubrobacteraceae bacterium]|jgi:hypothetical protein|nr:hypothetical protein [Solirubrobacteraceae bacterium]
MRTGRGRTATQLARARARRAAVATASLLALAAPLTTTSAAAAAPLLPDLVSDPPGPNRAPELYTDAQGSRLLMRLDGFVHNAGQGALEIRGSGQSSRRMTSVVQRVYDSDGGFQDRTSSPGPSVLFEDADGHNHWHLKNAMRYSLWSADRSAQVTAAQKVGFCLIDSQRIEAVRGRPAYSTVANNFCGMNDPTAAEVYMGISAGWRDYYSASLAFQWVDISDVAPGPYWLRADTDPDGVIQEVNENNPGAYAASQSIVNGYLARPVAAGNVSSTLPTTITLNASTFDDPFFGSPGARRFQIVTPPSRGTLSQPTGTWFQASRVRYTPQLGAGGADSFTYAAKDATSAFPRRPRTATVTLSINGLAGASAAAIGSPAAPQQVRASSASAPAGPARPAPSVVAPATPRRGLSRLVLARHARSLIATTVPGRYGLVRLVAMRGATRLGGCAVKARRGMPVTCAIELDRSVAPDPFFCRVPRTSGLKLPGVRATATLSAGGRQLAVRHARAR